jgi:hypothetical protein
LYDDGKYRTAREVRGSKECAPDLLQFAVSTMSTIITSPTSQTAPASLPPSVFTLPQTAQLEALFTIIRDKNTSRSDFLFYSDRIIRLLVEEGLNHLPVVPKTVETPTVSAVGQC